MAENTLAVRLPESYRHYLRRIGWGRFSCEELYGLGIDTPSHLELVKNAMAERDMMGPPMPPTLVPLMNDGARNHYCIDTSATIMGECPVVFWDHEEGHNQKPNKVADSFEQWLINLLAELSNF